MNLPTRQQNPGDLKDETGTIRTFASPAEGQAALYNDLTAKMTGTSSRGVGPSSSLVDFAKVYAPAGDGNNDPIKYAAELANQMNVSPDTQIGTLMPRIDDFAAAVAHNEGYQGGMSASIAPQQSDPNNPSSTANQSQPAPTADEQSAHDTGASFAYNSSSDTGASSGLKALGNIPSSAANFAEGVGHAVMHPIDTVSGIGNAVAGGVQEGYNALTGSQPSSNTQTDTFNALAQAMKNRYGSVENAARTATNDPMGFGSDIMAIITGGAGAIDLASGAGRASKLAELARANAVTPEAKAAIQTVPTASGALDNAVSTVAGKVTGPIGTVANKLGNVGAEAVGAPLGVTGGTIQKSMSAASQGGDAYKAFVEGLSGNTSQDELVTQAKAALGQVVDNRQATYKTMLEQLGKDKTTYDISPIFNEVDNQLNKFNITKNSNGSLDFSRSKFALDNTAQEDIENLTNYVKGYGTKAGDKTALGIDNLKQVLGGYYSPNSNYRAFTQGIKGATREILNAAPGYTKEMEDYSEMTGQIKDITRNLSLGDNAMVETSFKKLTSAFKQNNEFRKQLIGELDSVTGGQLSAKIAGQQMSSLMPRGLMKQLEVGGLGYATLSGTGLVPLLFTMMATSPKVVGTFIKGLGLTAQGYNKVMGLMSKGLSPSQVVLGGDAVNRLSPRQGLLPSLANRQASNRAQPI